MKRDFSQAQVEELWRIAERNQKELYEIAIEKFDDDEILEAAVGLWAAERFLEELKEKEAMTIRKLEQIITRLKEVDERYGGYLQTLNDQWDAYNQKITDLTELLRTEKLSLQNEQYRNEVQAVDRRYDEAKENSEIVKLELWLRPGYQLEKEELEEAREMVEAYFALGTDEGRVYYEDMYSPVDESVYADWTETHWKKFQLMGALDKKIGTLNSFGNGVVEAVPFWGGLSDLTQKTQAGMRGYEFEELCRSDNVFSNSHTQHPYVSFGGNLTGSLVVYELAAGAAECIPGLSRRISSLSGRLSTFPILKSIGRDHISNIIGATIIDAGVLTLPGAIGDVTDGESPGNVLRNAGLDIGKNLLFNIGGEVISGAVGAVVKKGKTSYGKSIGISEEKMYQQGQHYNKHGRDMGYSGKKEYEKAARDFFEQNKNTSEIYEGVWNSSRGGQSGQRQIIMRQDGKQLIINKESGQIIDFYEGTSLDGFVNIERVQ